ncbi:LAGLIDADG family homing endonuclease, partial [Patescibacteria group bacterium]|nr:LAGLIDADG family homing endonuclease [Patescibacteria group bacterium]
MAGFLDGDGCITIRFEKCRTSRLGYRARVRISFTQHKSKREILDLFCKRIGSGKVTEYKHNNMAEYVIYDQKVIFQILNNIETYVFVKRKHLKLAKELISLKRSEGYSKQSLMKEYIFLVA